MKVSKIIFTELTKTKISFSSLSGVKSTVYFLLDGKTSNVNEDFTIQQRGSTLFVTQNQNFEKERNIVINNIDISELSFKFSNVELKDIDAIQSLNVSNNSHINIGTVKQNILDLNVGGKSKLTIDNLVVGDFFLESLSSTILIKNGFSNNLDIGMAKSDLVTENFYVKRALFAELIDMSFLSTQSFDFDLDNVKIDKTSNAEIKKIINNLSEKELEESLKTKYQKVLTILKDEEPIFKFNSSNKEQLLKDMNYVYKMNKNKKLGLNKRQIRNLDRLLNYFNISNLKICRF